MAEISGGPRRRGPVVAVVLVLVAVVVGGAVGLELGRRHVSSTPGSLDAAPIPGTSPAYPQWVPYAPDTTDAPLPTDLSYVHDYIDAGANRWSVELPADWVIVKDDSLVKQREARFAPRGAIHAGYSLRIKRLAKPDRPSTPEKMRDRELMTLRSADYDDFDIFQQSIDSIGFTYRTPADATQGPNLHRWNIWTWVTPPGKQKAGLEISVGGRKVDQAGLSNLLRTVAASARPDPE